MSVALRVAENRFAAWAASACTAGTEITAYPPSKNSAVIPHLIKDLLFVKYMFPFHKSILSRGPEMSYPSCRRRYLTSEGNKYQVQACSQCFWYIRAAILINYGLVNLNHKCPFLGKMGKCLLRGSTCSDFFILKWLLVVGWPNVCRI